MVKTKMNQGIPKESLGSAFIPKGNEPYPVPENWNWIRSTEIFDIEYGKGLPISKLTSMGYPVFGANGIIGYHSEYTQEEERVLMTCRGATCGTINVTLPKSFVTSNSLILKPKWKANLKFVEYLFKSLDKRELISGSAQPQITVKAFNEYFLPFPPVKEQERIAKKIEILFKKIDKVIELVQEVKENSQPRIDSILDKAFSGELTKEWRFNNKVSTNSKDMLEDIINEKEELYRLKLKESQLRNKKKPLKPKKFKNDFVATNLRELPGTWTYCTLGDIVYDFKYGTSAKSDYNFNTQPVLRIPNIGENWIKTDDLKYLDMIIKDENHLVEKGDILIVRSNGSKDLVGKCSIVTENEVGYAFASYLIRIRPIKVLPEYILWLLKSHGVKNQFFSKSKSSAGINNINTEELATTIVPLPPIDEQKEIVRKIKMLIEMEERNLKLVDIDFDRLKQGILSKALRGELGTNDSTEESAMELLKEIVNC